MVALPWACREAVPAVPPDFVVPAPVLEELDDDLVEVPPEDLRGNGRPLLPEDPAFAFSFEAPAFGDWDASGEVTILFKSVENPFG